MDRELKRRLVANCKPDEPIEPGDPRHFDFDTPELCLRGDPWREWLSQAIDLNDSPTAQVVTGLRGSGKTTELKQFESDLSSRDYRVILADIGAWLSDTRPIVGEDLLLAAVLAIHPDGNPAGTSGWWKETSERIAKFFKSRVDLEGGALGVKAKLTTDDTLFQKVAQRLREADGTREEIHEILAAADEAARRDSEGLVLILDGAEKRATGDFYGNHERTTYHNHWFGAFIHNARDLKLPVHVVYTVPPFMIRRSAEIAAQFTGELGFLPMVRVLEHDGSVHAPGLEAMVRALRLRVPAEHFESPAIEAWLALHSGGYFRDLLRFINAMVLSIDGGQSRFTKQHADAAIERVRESYRNGFIVEEKAVLRQLHPARVFPESEPNLARMDALLQGFKMFRYHNGKSWYDAHPLLWTELNWADGLPTFEKIEAEFSNIE
ncbi:MAG: hypothetical protein HC927_02865 [Deltaproteobacteria bacterium]|nr:hypothetical protein [Deltaproteobacteria bacterium]